MKSNQRAKHTIPQNNNVKKLIKKSDKDIDYSDIPETKDFSGWIKVGNKSLDKVIEESILKQKIKVNWNEINAILDEIRKSTQKGRISLRLDSDIVEYYKNQGRKYQTKINDILRAFMLAEKKHIHSY